MAIFETTDSEYIEMRPQWLTAILEKVLSTAQKIAK
jgi:hypothetical protein